MGFMQSIRRAFYGDRDTRNASDALRNVGQLEWTGTLAAPLAAPVDPPPPGEIGPSNIPWELREDGEPSARS